MENLVLKPWHARTMLEWFELSRAESPGEPSLSMENRDILECWFMVAQGRGEAIPPRGATPWDGELTDIANTHESLAQALRLCLARALGETKEGKLGFVEIPDVGISIATSWLSKVVPYYLGLSDEETARALGIEPSYFRKRDPENSPTLTLPEIRVAHAWYRWMKLDRIGREAPNAEDRDLARELELHFAAGECKAATPSLLDRILMWFHLIPEGLGLMGPSDIEFARRLHEILDGKLMSLSQLWRTP